MLGSPAQSDNGQDNDDMVVIQQNERRILQSEPDDSDNSLNRRSEKKNSIEKLKSQIIYDQISQNPRGQLDTSQQSI